MKKGILITLMVFLTAQSYASANLSEEKNITIFKKEGPPLIHTKLIFKVGTQLDTQGGEIYLLSKILSQSGLTTILENAGSTLECSADYDFFTIEYEVLASEQKKVFTKIIQFLNHYQISKQEFLLAQSQLMQELKMQEDDYYDKVRFEFYKNLYQNHRYAKPLTGNFSSVRQIQLADIHAVYTKLLNQQWLHLVLVGSVSKKEFNFYHQLLKQLPSRAVDFPGDTVISPLTAEKTHIIQAPVTQVFVRIGCIGTKRNDPDAMYYQLISDVVGGGFGSIVMKKLREEKGLTYSPASNFYALRKDPGYFFVAFSTRQENLDKSLALLREIFENLSQNGIPAENFETSRRYLLGSLLQREETNQGISNLIAEAKIFDLETDYWISAKQAFFKLDYDKTNRLIKKFFTDKKYLTIILKSQDQ